MPEKRKKCIIFLKPFWLETVYLTWNENFAVKPFEGKSYETL